MTITNIDRVVPMAPGARPFLGHALLLARNPFTFLSSLPAYGDLVRIQLGPRAVVMVCDPELTRTMLLDDRTFDKGGPFYDRAREASGDGLATCPHRLHRRQRRLCQPAFNAERLASYTSAMIGTAQELAESWKDGEVIDVNVMTVTLTMRAMVKATFAAQVSPALERQLVDDLTVITGGSSAACSHTPGSITYRPRETCATTGRKPGSGASSPMP